MLTSCLPCLQGSFSEKPQLVHHCSRRATRANAWGEGGGHMVAGEAAPQDTPTNWRWHSKRGVRSGGAAGGKDRGYANGSHQTNCPRSLATRQRHCCHGRGRAMSHIPEFWNPWTVIITFCQPEQIWLRGFTTRAGQCVVILEWARRGAGRTRRGGCATAWHRWTSASTSHFVG